MQIIAQSTELSPSDYKTDQTLEDVFKVQQNALLNFQKQMSLKLSFLLESKQTSGDVFLGVHSEGFLTKVEAYFYHAGNEFNAPLVYSVNLTD